MTTPSAPTPAAPSSASQDPLAEAIAPGDTVASIAPLAGEAVTLPDPEGRYVIMELIRSADW